MAKKKIDVMDTTFRDGFQSVFGGRVLMEDFFPAVEAARDAGITHFEFGGGARFQTLFFYLRENAFEMMKRFREIVGPDANLQTLSRGVSYVGLDVGSSEVIDLNMKLFKKYGATTIRNFDALNDVNNLKFPAEAIKRHGLKHEVVVTMMDLPPGCEGAHDVPFYEKTLRDILDAGIEFDSVAFKDASGTANPKKIGETIRMARKLLGEDVHIRLHTHETAGVSVAAYIAALEAGADGIDLAQSPVSGGTSQPDILTMIHALKGTDFDLGLDKHKILESERILEECLKDYFIPPEATKVSPLIPFSPMPGGALTANTQMMRDNKILDKFPLAIKEMEEVVRKGGYGTSVTPVSQFYFQQALNNVMFGKWKKIAPGYGKMVLGYFGKTPVEPDPEVVALAKEQLGLEPTTEKALDIANRDETKSLDHFKKMLEDEGLETTEENLFIAASCDKKGIKFLKGEGEFLVRKLSDMEQNQGGKKMKKGEVQVFTVNVDGQSYNVTVVEGANANIEVKNITSADNGADVTPSGGKGAIEVRSQTPGKVWKILKNVGDKVEAGEKIMILEAMKMEIDITAEQAGTIKSIEVRVDDSVEDGQLLATME
ncbi:MAG TPA: biotin attachment protein [Campylobacterales bacterium]|nr:biotin attachment protein [Campylobacterales bacterium]